MEKSHHIDKLRPKYKLSDLLVFYFNRQAKSEMSDYVTELRVGENKVYLIPIGLL